MVGARDWHCFLFEMAMCWPHDVGMASAFSCLVGLVDYNGTTPPIVPFTFSIPKSHNTDSGFFICNLLSTRVTTTSLGYKSQKHSCIFTSDYSISFHETGYDAYAVRLRRNVEFGVSDTPFRSTVTCRSPTDNPESRWNVIAAECRKQRYVQPLLIWKFR
jgi:hypothetical protein